MRKGNDNEVEYSLGSFEYAGKINARWENERRKKNAFRSEYSASSRSIGVAFLVSAA